MDNLSSNSFFQTYTGITDQKTDRQKNYLIEAVQPMKDNKLRIFLGYKM